MEDIKVKSLTSWPTEKDGEKQELILIFEFRSDGWGVGDSTKERLRKKGVKLDRGFTMEGKMLWGYVNELDEMWVRFDHLVASTDKKRVLCEPQSIQFAEFLEQYPRSQKPFKRGSFSMINSACSVENKAVGHNFIDVDDDEPTSLRETEPGDKMDEEDQLFMAPQRTSIDEERAKKHWKAKFGKDN